MIYDRSFFEALVTAAKEFEPYCQYERYEEILRSCDVALLPLKSTRFNQMKSDLKFLECAGNGVAVLASPTVYGETIQDGETGLLFQSSDEFESRLRTLIEEPNLRHRLSHAAYNWVKEHRLLAYHFQERQRWYLHMRDQLPQLNQQLRERIPELF